MEQIYQTRHSYEQSLQAGKSDNFAVAGFSYPARAVVDFQVSFAWSDGANVNWREWLICPVTHLNNRMRAAVQLVDSELGVLPNESIYITEQITPLFKHLSNSFNNIVGSEFLGNEVPLGAADSRGVRNEDLTQLTFSDSSFDCLLSFDCFEHMPDFESGMREVSRVIKKGGRMLWSVPFRNDLVCNLRRASCGSRGEIIHHELPEYHGDPLNTSGCLCFTHFGWEILEQVKRSGFSDVYAVTYWSDVFCYLGIEQIVFIAIK